MNESLTSCCVQSQSWKLTLANFLSPQSFAVFTAMESAFSSCNVVLILLR